MKRLRAFRRALYALARILGDVIALFTGPRAIVRRIINRIIGRTLSRLFLRRFP